MDTYVVPLCFRCRHLDLGGKTPYCLYKAMIVEPELECGCEHHYPYVPIKSRREEQK